MSNQIGYVSVPTTGDHLYFQYNNHMDKAYSKLYRDIDDAAEEFRKGSEETVTCTCGGGAVPAELYSDHLHWAGLEYEPTEVEVCTSCLCIVVPKHLVMDL